LVNAFSDDSFFLYNSSNGKKKGGNER